MIGVYEPLVVVRGGDIRATSRAAEPALSSGAGERYHRACYVERFGPDTESTTPA